MGRRARASSRSARYPIRWPFVLGWSVGLGASAAALAGLIYVAGRDRPKVVSGAGDTMLVALARPGVALGAACAALVLLAFCVRHLVLQWLASRPGRIAVATFTAGTPLSDANVEQLTTDFRRRLVSLHLQTPTPVPGAAPEGDFLDVLSRNGVDHRNPLATLINLLRAATPTHAYEVRGTALEREARPRFGITVSVLRLPGGGNALPVTVWGDTWDAALASAADEATAAILPQTRRCRAPWGVWRGHVMPAGLVPAFEEGARLEHQRRYDEALNAYWHAVHLDPMNIALRLRLGQLQERLGLYLDALATYWGIAESGRPAGPRLTRLVHRGRGRRERKRVMISARYRRNVLLGGRVLAQQWRVVPDDPAHPTRRDEQRQRLRQCLRARLDPQLAEGALDDLAVSRLVQATGRADSAFIASRRDWVLSEDPDLNGLRATHAFEQFEVMHLPSDRLTPRRPRKVQRLESFRYVRALLAATAQRWQATWRARAEQSGHDIRALREWFADEQRAWEGVRDVAVHYRHSGSRFALIRATRECADRYGFEPLDVGFPRFDKDPFAEAVAGKPCDDICEDAVDLAVRRTERLAATLRDPRRPRRSDAAARRPRALAGRAARGRRGRPDAPHAHGRAPLPSPRGALATPRAVAARAGRRARRRGDRVPLGRGARRRLRRPVAASRGVAERPRSRRAISPRGGIGELLARRAMVRAAGQANFLQGKRESEVARERKTITATRGVT